MEKPSNKMADFGPPFLLVRRSSVRLDGRTVSIFPHPSTKHPQPTLPEPAHENLRSSACEHSSKPDHPSFPSPRIPGSHHCSGPHIPPPQSSSSAPLARTASLPASRALRP